MTNEKLHELALMISGMAYEMSMHNHTFFRFEQRVELYLKRELQKKDANHDENNNRTDAPV